MNEQFVFAASCLCLAVGLGLCLLPANRYFRSSSIGYAGTLFLVCGMVLMTTFKWTEVAIKVSELEVRLSEAQQEAAKARISLAMVQKGVTPEATSQAIEAVLATYKKVSNTDPSPDQVADFTTALNAANVTIIPVEALSGVEGYQKLIFEPMK